MPYVPDPEIDARFPWDLECLICKEVAEDIMPESLNGVSSPLVRMQEHLMSAHGADQEEFSRHSHVYIRSDGTEWLGATWRPTKEVKS